MSNIIYFLNQSLRQVEVRDCWLIAFTVEIMPVEQINALLKQFRNMPGTEYIQITNCLVNLRPGEKLFKHTSEPIDVNLGANRNNEPNRTLGSGEIPES